MNEREAAEVYAYACTIWGEEPADAVLNAWIVALAPIDRRRVDRRIQELITDCHRYMPRVPEIVGTPQPVDGQVVQRDGCMFMPGIGWLGGRRPDGGAPELPPAVETGVPSVSAGEAMATARAATARARLSSGADPELTRRVDAAAAALRMQDESAEMPFSAPSAGPTPAPPPPKRPMAQALAELRRQLAEKAPRPEVEP